MADNKPMLLYAATYDSLSAALENTRWIDRLITLRGIDDEQSVKLAEIAAKTPVTRAVRAGTEIRTTTGIR